MSDSHSPSVAGTYDILPGPAGLSTYPYILKAFQRSDGVTYISPSGSIPLLRLMEGICSNFLCPGERLSLVEPTIAALFRLELRRG